MKKPGGVLLITPESLEATLFNHGSSLRGIFSSLLFLIIDELHAFIGSERGKQLQSLLHRIDHIRGMPVTRIGLSATLGDMSLAADFMRPGSSRSVFLIESKSASKDLLIEARGFEEPAHIISERQADSEEALNPDYADDISESATTKPDVSPTRIALSIYNAMRGSNNRIFSKLAC